MSKTSRMKKILTVVGISLFAMSSISLVAYALNTFTLSYTITGGISVGIWDDADDDLSSLTLTSTAVSYSADSTQTATATLSSNDGYFVVVNTNDTASEWSLDLAPTAGSSALWTTTGGTKMDFNDDVSGDDEDVDGVGGQLKIDLANASITETFESTGTTGVTQGSTAAFSDQVNSIKLMSGGATAEAPGGWKITGIDFKQLIPAGQSGGTYTLGMTLTVN